MKTTMVLWILAVIGFGALVAASGGNGTGASGESGAEAASDDDARTQDARTRPAPLTTREIAYEHDGVALRGFLAAPENARRAPCVVIVHAWRGHSDYVRRRAEMLAQLGYAAFALDMYGDGVLAKDNDEASRLAGAFYADRDLMRARFKAGLDTLLAQPEADPRHAGAIGYCFGGTVVLEAARTGGRLGLELDAVVGFHAGLKFDESPKPGQVRPSVLVCNGYNDSVVPPEQRAQFMREMQDAGADFVFVEYADAVHAFTEREAGDRYNERADVRSWAHMKQLLRERLRSRSDD